MTTATDHAVLSEAQLRTLPVRLLPGDDLRHELERLLGAHGAVGGFVLAGIGSLSTASVRLAGASDASTIEGDTEVLTLSGSLAAGGAHLHIAVSDAHGRVVGGHAGYGCIVRTTAEILVALLPAWRLTREPDPATGWNELVIAPNTVDRDARRASAIVRVP